MPTRRIIDSWLKSITPYRFAPEELSDRLMNLGLEVESVENRYEQLEGFVVGQVLSREKHPNADKLSVCTVNDGLRTLTVVCGAPNVAAGQKIAFAPVGTRIPAAGITIEPRKIRGVASEGMICSEVELGIGEDGSGILVLPEEAPVGTPLAELLGDVVYDVEITPNRGDCLSHLGVAREVSAITGEPVFLPSSDVVESDQPTTSVARVTINDPDLCPRYAARVVRGVRVAPSPEWLQDTLRKLGLRPRNNIVDVTSYVMFECGHPLHAFDHDRLAGGEIVVRALETGERFQTLDGKDHDLPARALMICDAEKPVAIAGIMGGANSEISDGTTNVLLESAWFHPPSIRRTARLLGISTDASYRFERGADIGNVCCALDRAASMIASIAGGEVLRDIIDVYPQPRPELIIELRFERTNSIVGMSIDPELQMSLLRRLGFSVDPVDDTRAMVVVPSYRVDVFGEIDLIEEIARLRGYGDIPLETRAMVGSVAEPDRLQRVVADTRAFFVDNGCFEIVSAYLVDPETAGRYGNPVTLRNALGRDFSALRTSLAPSMARTVGLNQRYSRPDLRLFEIGTAFRASASRPSPIEGVQEMQELAVVLTGRAEPVSWDIPERPVDLFDLRGLIERYLERLGYRDYRFDVSSDARWGFDGDALALTVGDQEAGRLGRLDPALKEQYDIDGEPMMAVIDLQRLAAVVPPQPRYRAPSRYPVVARDLSIVVAESIPEAHVERTIADAAGPLLSGLTLFDVYVGGGIPQGNRSLAYALNFTSHEGTLEDSVVDATMRRITENLAREHGAQLRGV